MGLTFFKQTIVPAVDVCSGRKICSFPHSTETGGIKGYLTLLVGGGVPPIDRRQSCPKGGSRPTSCPLNATETRDRVYGP